MSDPKPRPYISMAEVRYQQSSKIVEREASNLSGKKLPVLLLLTSLILGGLVPYISVQTAHAANTTPLVCIAQPVIDKICPATGPPTFNGNFTQPDSTRLLFTVFINGSDPMNGFDITLKSSNPSVLK